MNNDSLLGNFFIELIKNKKESVTFEQIFDFVYYASLKLEEENKTTEILVSKSGICSFIEAYHVFLTSAEEENSIKINLDTSKKTDFKRLLEQRFMEENFSHIYEYAFQQAFSEVA